MNIESRFHSNLHWQSDSIPRGLLIFIIELWFLGGLLILANKWKFENRGTFQVIGVVLLVVTLLFMIKLEVSRRINFKHRIKSDFDFNSIVIPIIGILPFLAIAFLFGFGSKDSTLIGFPIIIGAFIGIIFLLVLAIGMKRKMTLDILGIEIDILEMVELLKQAGSNSGQKYLRQGNVILYTSVEPKLRAWVEKQYNGFRVCIYGVRKANLDISKILEKEILNLIKDRYSPRLH